MTDNKHSPLPWKIGRGKVTGQICVQSDDAWICSQFHNQDDEMSKDEANANAQFIVTACNSHYENLETIEVLKSALENITRDYEGFDDTQLERRVNTSGHFMSVVMARNALAKVMSEFKDSATKTTVRKVWRNEYHDGRWFDFVDKHLAVLDGGTSALRIAVPITITEKEGHDHG